MARPAGRGRAVAILGVVVALAVSACSGSSTESLPPPVATVQSGGTLRLGLVAPDLAVDPAAASPADAPAMQVLDLLWARLTTTEPGELAAEPALASSWDASSDLTRFTFRLRPDATFSDGSALTATDVVASLRRVAAQGGASLAGSALADVVGARTADGATGGLEGIEAPDATTVVITLTRPEADLPTILAAPAYGVMRAADATWGDGPARPLVTSGPYALAGDDGVTAHLERSVGTGSLAAPPDAIDIVRYPTVEAAAADYAAGALDLLPVPAGRVGELVEPGVGYVSTSAGSAVWWVAANTTSPVVSTIESRRAVARGIDTAAIVAADLPGRRVLKGVMPPQVPGGTADACGATCTPDSEAMTRDLATAFPGGAPPVRIDVSDEPQPRVATDAVATALNTGGWPASVYPRPYVDYRAGVLGAERELFWFGWIGVAPTAESYLPALFLTGSPDNVTGVADPSVDAAIAAARSTADDEARAEAWAAAEQVVLERLPVVPLAQAQNAMALTARVQGYTARLDGTFVIGKLWLEQDP